MEKGFGASGSHRQFGGTQVMMLYHLRHIEGLAADLSDCGGDVESFEVDDDDDDACKSSAGADLCSSITELHQSESGMRG